MARPPRSRPIEDANPDRPDRLVRGASTVRTAIYHGGEHRTVRGMGHFLQLDVGAEDLVEALVGWMEQRSLVGPGPAAN